MEADGGGKKKRGNPKWKKGVSGNPNGGVPGPSRTGRKVKLTDKREKFCQEYLVDSNATRAAKAAGYSQRTAYVLGERLLHKEVVQNRLAQLRKELREASDITPEKVLAELTKVGFSNIQKFIAENNNIVDVSKLDSNIAAAVESIQSNIRHDGGKSEGYTEKVKLKLHSKISALEDIAKMLGMFEKDNEQRKPQTVITIS